MGLIAESRKDAITSKQDGFFTIYVASRPKDLGIPDFKWADNRTVVTNDTRGEHFKLEPALSCQNAEIFTSLCKIFF